MGSCLHLWVALLLRGRCVWLSLGGWVFLVGGKWWWKAVLSPVSFLGECVCVCVCVCVCMCVYVCVMPHIFVIHAAVCHPSTPSWSWVKWLHLGVCMALSNTVSAASQGREHKQRAQRFQGAQKKDSVLCLACVLPTWVCRTKGKDQTRCPSQFHTDWPCPWALTVHVQNT